MRRATAIACFCMALWATPAWATNDVTLTTGAGKSCGMFNVSGTVTADSGWTPGSTITISVWKDGCLVTTAPVTLTSSGCNTWTFDADVGGVCLMSSITFNVVGDVTFTSLCACPETFRTQPTTGTTK